MEIQYRTAEAGQAISLILDVIWTEIILLFCFKNYSETTEKAILCFTSLCKSSVAA